MLTQLKQELPHMKIFYAMSILTGFTELVTPVWVLYFIAVGLTPPQIGLLFVAWGIAAFLFEIPTGAIADQYGRKLSVVISYLMFGTVFIFIAFAQSFTLLLLLMFMLGVAETFTTGAMDAWLIDTLRHEKKESWVYRCLSRKKSLFLLATVPSFLMASVLIALGLSESVSFLGILRWLWIGSGVICIFTAIVALAFGTESYFHRSKQQFTDVFKEVLRMSKSGAAHAFQHPVLLFLMIGNGLSMFALMVFVVGWQPFFQDLVHIPPVYFGVLLAVLGVLSAAVLTQSTKILKYLGHARDAIIILTIIAMASLFIFAQNFAIMVTLAGAAIFWIIFELLEPLQVHYFNKFVPSKSRATIGSVSSMFSTIFTSLGFYVGYGLFTNWFGLQTAFSVSAGIGASSIFVYLLIKKHPAVKQPSRPDTALHTPSHPHVPAQKSTGQRASPSLSRSQTRPGSSSRKQARLGNLGRSKR